MASDYTAPKRYMFLTQTNGDATALLPCPSCHRVMALDDLHLLLAVGEHRVHFLDVAEAEFSHTVAESRGGKEGALECKECNGERGDDADWVPPVGTMVVRQGKKKMYEEAMGAGERSRARIKEMRSTRR